MYLCCQRASLTHPHPNQKHPSRSAAGAAFRSYYSLTLLSIKQRCSVFLLGSTRNTRSERYSLGIHLYERLWLSGHFNVTISAPTAPPDVAERRQSPKKGVTPKFHQMRVWSISAMAAELIRFSPSQCVCLHWLRCITTPSQIQ